MAGTKTFFGAGTGTGIADAQGLTARAQQAAQQYKQAVSSAAQRAAKGINNGSGRTAAGYARVKEQTTQDYGSIDAARRSLQEANGDRLGAGADSVAATTARENALGTLNRAEAASAANSADTAQSLAAQADTKAASAAYGQEDLAQQYAAKEATRQEDAERTQYEWSQQQARKAQQLTDKQTNDKQSYLRELGLICLQLGYVPGKDMLDALGLDEATAKSFAKYYWRYGY